MTLKEIDYSQTSSEVENWFGLQSPTFMLSVLGLYLLYVLKIGPNYMKNRPAYELKTYIICYNIAQVIACLYVVGQTLNIVSFSVFEFWKCSLFPSNTRQEYLFNRLSYFTMWLKFSELSETIVFVLRKKQSQVSALHVFHHCATITLIYFLFKYRGGGSALYPLLLNSNVHIIMYSYYLAAAVCSKDVIQRLTPIKKSITTIQMIQFVLILIQAVIHTCRCTVPYALTAYYATVVLIIFYGFYDFYKKSYTKTSLKP